MTTSRMDALASFVRHYGIWIPLAGIVFIIFAWWLNLRLIRARDGWRYTKESIPELGHVDAVYLKGKLLWMDCDRYGVNIQINCEDDAAKQAGINYAKAVTKAQLDEHFQNAIRSIPDDELRVWGFDRGQWVLEKVIVGGPDSHVLELGNSADRDHCCRVIFEKGNYEFETVDG